MITVDGVPWGTAAEIAEHLGHGVTAAAVRAWVRRDGLPAVRLPDACGRPRVRHPLPAAATIERAKRHAGRGRKRPA
jgi:hypothetical protein